MKKITLYMLCVSLFAACHSAKYTASFMRGTQHDFYAHKQSAAYDSFALVASSRAEIAPSLTAAPRSQTSSPSKKEMRKMLVRQAKEAGKKIKAEGQTIKRQFKSYLKKGDDKATADKPVGRKLKGLLIAGLSVLGLACLFVFMAFFVAGSMDTLFFALALTSIITGLILGLAGIMSMLSWMANNTVGR